MFRLIKNTKAKAKKGQALILAYVVLIFLTILVASLLAKAANDNRLAQRQRLVQEAIYLAEGGIEDTINAFRAAIANFDVGPDIDTWPVQPDPEPDPPVYHATTYGSFYNATVDSIGRSLVDEAGVPIPDRAVDIPGGAVAFERNYKITATVQHPLNSGITVTLHQIVGRRMIPAFQHCIFYDQDLELLPGPDMSLTGRIHGNQDIYLGSHNDLTLDTFYLHSAGNIYNNRKNDGSLMGGTVDIRITKPEEEPAEFAAMAGLDCNDPTWTGESQTRWQGTVKSAVHGVTKLAAPEVGSIQPDGYYASEADVKIENDTITQGGVELTPGVDIPNDTVNTTFGFYNNREDKTVQMTDIDMQKLAGYATEEEYINGTPSFPNHLPDNGLMYATTEDLLGINQPGIRLVNAEEIESDIGLTVVTNDPLYIQGDYNTEDKKPAAVICDALNILSSTWDDDADSHLSLNQRRAEETTINTAFVAGIDNTDPLINQYNGGLENYPRMHESWSNVNLNILGAFLALWNSQIAQGVWEYGGSQYTAPRRNWNYDQDFSNPSLANLPPFFPWAVEMSRVAWWREQ